MNPRRFVNSIPNFILMVSVVFLIASAGLFEPFFSSPCLATQVKPSPGPTTVGDFSLTKEERDWLRDHPVIRVAQDPGWPPIEFADEKGAPIGISNDYLHLLEQRLGIKFKLARGLSWQQAYARLKRWELDMTTSVTTTPERERFWAFTKPYMRIPIVILTHSDVTYVGNMRQLSGKKVAMVDGYAVCDWFPQDFPGIKIVKVKTTKDGIDLLQTREVFAFVDNMLVIGYYLAQLKMSNLKIAGETPYQNAQSMAVRKDWLPLVGILQKAIDSIGEEEQRRIYNKWVPIHYAHGFDYKLLWQLLAAFGVILTVLVVWNRRLSREIRLRKKTEARLSASEQRFRQLFDISPISAGIVDRNGNLRDLNRKFVDTFGFTDKEAPTLEEWWRRAYPDPEYRRVIKSRLEEYTRRALKTGADIEPVESRIVGKDGNELTIITSGALLDDLFLYVFYDITERKQAEQTLRESEEKFHIIFKRAPLMAAISSLDDDTVLEVNDKLLELSGYKQEEVLGRTAIELGWLVGEDRARMMKTLQEEGRVSGMEITCRDKAGKPIPCLFNCELVSIGDTRRLLALMEDISERKRAENEKDRLEAQLHQAQKMEAIGTLAGGVAHDFNNILGAIYGYSELALKAAEDERDNTAELMGILKAAQRAKGLVSQILTFSRKVEVELEPLDLNRQMESAVAMLGRTLSKMIRIETKLAGDLRPVKANATQMEQIIFNLATNAQDAMPEGGVLTIETQQLDLDEEYCKQYLGLSPGLYVLLQVSDTGQGMDESTREHIFEPFYTTKALGKGTGLGLSTVYGIIKNHGGHISCYSELGLGATFKIFLPTVGDDIRESEKTEQWSTDDLKGAGRVLLVDDEEALRELGASTLARAGYSVETAASGEEALLAVEGADQDFDLIIMDLGMPGMGGFKALEAILKLRPTAKVIIASGYAATGQVKTLLESGAAGYVAKPFRSVDILTTAKTIIGRK